MKRKLQLRGRGFFHSKGTWGCAARKGILFRTSSLAKGILLAILVEFSLGKGMLFGNFGKEKSNFGNSCQEIQIFKNFGPENAKI